MKIWQLAPSLGTREARPAPGSVTHLVLPALALGLITPVFLKTFSVLPFMESLAGFLVSVFNIGPLLFMILGILHVLQGRAVRLPLIGGFDILKD